MRRLKQTLIAFDQLLNALLLDGWADETISARAWRRRNTSKGWAWARVFIDTLFFFDRDHCRESYYSEKMRMHLPPSERETDKRIK